MKSALLTGTTAGANQLVANTPVVAAIPHHDNANNGAWLVQLFDGRVFITLSESIRPFALPGDEDALPAFTRAFSHSPHLFRHLEKPEAPKVIDQLPEGITADITDADRMRLRKIIMRHWKAYFAEQPTNKQMDQLIDALGPRVAANVVKKQVDAGRID